MGCDTHGPTKTGGGERIRTDDILLAKQALYQLSYAPRTDLLRKSCPVRQQDCLILRKHSVRTSSRQQLDAVVAHASFQRADYQSNGFDLSSARTNAARLFVVGQGGFEPPTSRLSSARSNQLSY